MSDEQIPIEFAHSGAKDVSESNAMIPELMTVSDFLQLYRISNSSFYKEVNAGRLQIVKFGRSTRIPRASAEAWVAQLPKG